MLLLLLLLWRVGFVERIVLSISFRLTEIQVLREEGNASVAMRRSLVQTSMGGRRESVGVAWAQR